MMSLRTMPLSARTLTPFEPSPGKGPAVSSGVSATVVPDELPLSVSAELPVQPASVASPRPPAAAGRGGG
jgi:hypothetical protein